MRTFQEIKDLSVDELRAGYRDLSKEIYDLKCELACSRKLDKPHLVKGKKRERARMLTALTQKGAA